MPQNKICPFCGRLSLRFIEDCESDPDAKKSSWTCDCNDFVIYIVQFIREANDVHE